MNTKAHWLSLFSGLMHLIIGVTALGSQFLPPSWVIIYKYIPGSDWIYPNLWIMTGITALFGVVYPRHLRIGFRLSAALFFMWGIAGIDAWLEKVGGNPQGFLANLFVACCLWVLSDYVTSGVRSDKIDRQADRLKTQIDDSTK